MLSRSIADKLRLLARVVVAGTLGTGCGTSPSERPIHPAPAAATSGMTEPERAPSVEASRVEPPTRPRTTELAGWIPVECTGDRVTPLDATLEFAQTFDWLSLYAAEAPRMYRAVLNPEGWAPQWLGSLGHACATSRNRKRCETKLERLTRPADACLTRGECPAYAVLTHGDRIVRIGGVEEMRKLLRLPIDSASEALLIAVAANLPVRCPRGSSSTPGVGTELRELVGVGYTVRSPRDTGCDVAHDQVYIRLDGSVSHVDIQPEGTCQIGRRASEQGLPSLTPDLTPMQRHLSYVTQLEAGSVPAFLRLAHELRRLSAPRALWFDALRSAHDEALHAALFDELGREAGVAVPPLRHVAMPARSTADMAAENAAEGCVRETYGALSAHYAARHATVPALATIMSRIAADETRHAALAFRISAWLDRNGSSAHRDAIAVARTRALQQLAADIEHEPLPHEAARAFGVPTLAERRRIFELLLRTLWSAPVRHA